MLPVAAGALPNASGSVPTDAGVQEFAVFYCRELGELHSSRCVCVCVFMCVFVSV